VTAPVHLPVLVEESIAALAPRAGAVLLDGTVGLGGHALAWLRATVAAGEAGRVLGLDRDPHAIAIAQARLDAEFPGRATLRRAAFETAPAAVGSMTPDAALLDLGVSSMQLDDPARGFSFQAAGPLDMRMSGAAGETESASDLVNSRSAAELTRIFTEYGEEPAARKIADAIVADRAVAPFRDTLRLAETIARATGGRRGRLHPATRVFQALRIETNDEMGSLRRGLPAVTSTVRPGGRVAVITFHRLEDAECKRFLADGASRGALRLLPDRTPSRAEVGRNPRARSARLRAAEVLRPWREVA
jgi:16S rRNA (cytosine1402-N4)-methyltransferase